jgi:TPP-dependent pyruvate/acetoin dehydrogenase alpha subunit
MSSKTTGKRANGAAGASVSKANGAQGITREQYLDLYYYMRLNRAVEDQMVKLFRQNKIVGGLYSSLGQEGISVGTAYALEKRDWMAPMIRNIGALLVKGVAPRDIFTQHMAKYTSPTQGKDGTSHFGDLKNLHIVSPISMLGDLIPVMTGVGMAGRFLGQNIVAMTWIGDGGSSTGAFHEGLNLAASQKAPLVLVLENNQWAYSTHVSRQVPLRNLADRGRAYGINTMIVDGNDVAAVFETSRRAVELCRAGDGPVLIEAKTHRMRGHAQHDPAEYVPKEMREFWEKRDPIARYEKYLTERKLWSAGDKEKVEKRIADLLKGELEFAENSPMPPPELAEQGVYCEDGCHVIEADWQRPKEEVMPPRTVCETKWKVQDYGQCEPESRETREERAAYAPEPGHVNALASKEEEGEGVRASAAPGGAGGNGKAAGKKSGSSRNGAKSNASAKVKAGAKKGRR